MGQLPSLLILNTEFIANNAAQLGGAGVVAEFFEDIALEFSGNSGERNTAVFVLRFLQPLRVLHRCVWRSMPTIPDEHALSLNGT